MPSAWCLEPHFHFRPLESYLHFGVQSLHLFSVRYSESSCLSFIRSITIFLHYGVQSHWAHSFRPFFESFLLFSFGVQSRFSYPFMHLESFLFLVSAFRATVLFGIQCHYHLFISFGVQSRCTYPFRHFESPFSFLLLMFRVISP